VGASLPLLHVAVLTAVRSFDNHNFIYSHTYIVSVVCVCEWARRSPEVWRRRLRRWVDG